MGITEKKISSGRLTQEEEMPRDVHQTVEEAPPEPQVAEVKK